MTITKKQTDYDFVESAEKRRFHERLIAAALVGYISGNGGISSEGIRTAIKAADYAFKFVTEREI